MGEGETLSTIVEFDSVGLRYGTGAEVLRDLDFRLRRGGFYFLTGPSGAGKTSLLKLLYLAQRPTRGRVSLFGGGPFEDAHPEDQDAARRIAAAVLLAARAEPSRLRDALRCVLDIGSRRLLLPSEVVHWEALLAEASTAPAAGKGVDADKFMAAFNCEAENTIGTRLYNSERQNVINALEAALTRQPVAGDGK